MKRAYLHGFASGPRAKKGQALKAAFEARGESFLTPDLNAPSFAELSMGAMLERVDGLDRTEGDEDGWALVGSSLGGWLAAAWAERHPDRVQRLLLLCPAFDVPTRWPDIMPPGAMARWAREGRFMMQDGEGVLQPLHHAFYEESRTLPTHPAVPCATKIVHGTRDDRVPIASSRAYAASHPNVELIEVDDGHDLIASLQTIVALALDWL